VHGLAESLLRVALGVWLPLMLAASVTGSLGAMIMFVAGMLLAWAAMLQFVMSGTLSRMSPRHELVVFAPLFAMLMVGSLIFQYATRDTARSRIAIAGVLGLVLLLAFGVDRAGFGAPVRKLIDAQYPVPQDGALKLVFAPGTIPYDERKQEVNMRLEHGVELRLPVHLEGLPVDAQIRGPHVSVEVSGGGASYVSPWKDAKLSDDMLEFTVPNEAYEAMKLGKAKSFRVQLSAEELRLAQTSQAVIARRFRGPNGGVCVDADGTVVCRFAYEQNVPMRVVLRSTAEACLTHKGNEDVGVEPWVVFPAGGRFDPVIQEPVKPLDERDVCPGDVLTFSEYALERTFRLSVDLPTQDIAEYRVR
jgi:hypothetical protein